jgi:hypothetical protein
MRFGVMQTVWNKQFHRQCLERSPRYSRVSGKQEVLRLRALECKLRKRGEVQVIINTVPRPEVRTGRQTAAYIIYTIATQNGMTVAQMKSCDRHRNVTTVRQRIYYELACETRLSLVAIGKLLGGRDHTTIISGIRKHAKRNALLLPGRCRNAHG